MGQPVTVIEKPSSHPGVVRYETNRVLTGMGHEFYTSAADATADRPADIVARRLFARGGIESVHINGGVITVTLRTDDTAGLKEIIEGMYTYYVPGVEPPTDEEMMAAAE